MKSYERFNAIEPITNKTISSPNNIQYETVREKQLQCTCEFNQLDDCDFCKKSQLSTSKLLPNVEAVKIEDKPVKNTKKN